MEDSIEQRTTLVAEGGRVVGVDLERVRVHRLEGFELLIVLLSLLICSNLI